MKCASAVASLVMALGVTAAHAKECKGIFFPDHTQVQGVLLTLNGLGLRRASSCSNSYAG